MLNALFFREHTIGWNEVMDFKVQSVQTWYVVGLHTRKFSKPRAHGKIEFPQPSATDELSLFSLQFNFYFILPGAATNCHPQK